jgi:hypothetical protein
MRQEHAAEVGWLNPFLVAVEEIEADSAFQLLDAAGERWLSQVQSARGTREATCFSEGPRMLEQPEIEVHAAMLLDSQVTNRDRFSPRTC